MPGKVPQVESAVWLSKAVGEKYGAPKPVVFTNQLFEFVDSDCVPFENVWVESDKLKLPRKPLGEP